MSLDKFISKNKFLKGQSFAISFSKMLPEIKTRLRTEELRVNNERSFDNFKKKLAARNSNLNACMPYLDQLRHGGITYSIQKRPKKHIKRQRIQSDYTAKNIYSQTRAQHYVKPEAKQKYETLPSTSVEVRTAKDVQLNQKKPIIECLMKYIEKAKESDLDKSEIRLENSRSSRRYNLCEEQLDNLPKDKSQWNHDTTEKFTEKLIGVNPFFKKLNKVIVLCLLKVGRIKTYQEEEIIQIENSHIQRIGIILWGQVLLKNQQNKMKIYLFPGDSLNEELVLFENSENSSNIYYLKKGSIKSKQTAKAKGRTAILYLKLDEYKMIYEELVKIGQKSSILKAQNMIKRCYAKKKNLRKQFSYL